MSISGLIYCKGAYLDDYEYEVGDYFSVSGSITGTLEDPAYPAAPSHSWKYTDNGDGTHSAVCTDDGCTEKITNENHTYEAKDGKLVCVCGAEGNGSDPKSFHYEVKNGEATITGYVGLDGEITLSDTYTDENGTYPVTAVAARAFNGSNGDTATSSAESLSKITVPASIVSVGDYAFNYVGRYHTRLWSLTEIVFVAENVTFGRSALGGNPNLKSVTLPAKLTKIGSSMFSNDTSLTTLTIPASVTEIDTQAFSGCTALTEVNFKSVTPPHHG